MLRSSRSFARRVMDGGNKVFLSATESSSQKTKSFSRKISAALAATGTAGCCAVAMHGDESDNGNPTSVLERLAPLTNAAPITTATTTTNCTGSSDFAAREAKLKRKKTVLKVAASLERLNTSRQVERLRIMQDEMLTRWERDEEGWRNLPSRAWPEYQPNPDELQGVVAEIERLGCTEKILSKQEAEVAKQLESSSNNSRFSLLKRKQSCSFNQCMKLLFDMASGLVFYNVDNAAGLALYESLARRGHTDAMVACGIVLVEGLGVPPNEHEGLAWLEKAMISQSSDTSSMSVAQASYELGTVYYTGIDGVVEEDPEKAFELFSKAAEKDHTAALYMVADCLVEGEGTERSVSRAVPLFYKAAERGHRYSRQRIRELLAKGGYPL